MHGQTLLVEANIKIFKKYTCTYVPNIFIVQFNISIYCINISFFLISETRDIKSDEQVTSQRPKCSSNYRIYIINIQ